MMRPNGAFSLISGAARHEKSPRTMSSALVSFISWTMMQGSPLTIHSCVPGAVPTWPISGNSPRWSASAKMRSTMCAAACALRLSFGVAAADAKCNQGARVADHGGSDRGMQLVGVLARQGEVRRKFARLGKQGRESVGVEGLEFDQLVWNSTTG